MMTLMEKKRLSFLTNMYSFNNTDLETFSFVSSDLSRSWSIWSWNRSDLHRKVRSFGEKPYSSWGRPSLLVLIMVLNTWDTCILRATRANILFICQFRYQVSTNRFFGEENFRNGVLAKHSYFQVVAMNECRISLGLFVDRLFYCSSGFLSSLCWRQQRLKHKISK